MRQAMFIAVSLIVAGCATMTTPSPTCPDGGKCEFAGLAESLNGSETLHVLVVHGMGSPEVGWSRSLVNEISRELRLTAVGGGGVRRIPNEDDKDCNAQAILAIRRFTDPSGDRQMLVYEVTWSPIVDELKEALRYDSDPERAAPRARLNRSLKKHLINERLADPVLYVGYRRKAMQYPVRFTLCQILGGTPWGEECAFSGGDIVGRYGHRALGARDKLAIITYSLGSRLTFDALAELIDAFDTGDEAQARLKGKLTTFFMLANQLPLLELAERDILAGDSFGIADVGRLLKGGAEKSFSVVAISDPNDLLSYDISDTFAWSAPDIRFVNVNARLGRSYWGFVVDPLGAHTRHDQNATVIRYITHGLR